MATILHIRALTAVQVVAPIGAVLRGVLLLGQTATTGERAVETSAGQVAVQVQQEGLVHPRPLPWVPSVLLEWE